MTVNPTGSALARAIACPLSETLPHVKSSSSYAEAGNARHSYLQNIGTMGAEAALEKVEPQHRDACAIIDHESLPTNLAAEVAFAWDSVTLEARELGRDLQRDYSSATKSEICLTVDVLGVSDDAVYICDYKGYEFVSVHQNAQLLAGALCAAKVYGKEKAILEIVNIRGGSNAKQRIEVDIFDLGIFEVKLLNMLAAIEDIRGGVKAEAVEGSHCKYCPAWDSCPAKTKLMRAMISGEEEVRIEAVLPLTPEMATIAYQQLRAMESLVKRARDIVYAYASERPIQLGGGRVFGAHTKPGNERIDGDVAYVQLRDLLGQSAADIAVERKATKAGIARAVKHAKQVSKIDKTLKAITSEVMGAIAAGNGISRKPTTTVEEHQAELTG